MHTQCITYGGLGVVAMADPITNYFRVENACTPNIKLLSPSLLLLAVLPPSPIYDYVRLDNTPTTPTLIISATLGVCCNIDGTIRKRRRKKRHVRKFRLFPHQIIMSFWFVC
jgi:hypothetical protein